MILIFEPSFESMNASIVEMNGAADKLFKLKMPSDPDHLGIELKKMVGDDLLQGIAIKLLFGGDYFQKTTKVDLSFHAALDDLFPSYPVYFSLVKCAILTRLTIRLKTFNDP